MDPKNIRISDYSYSLPQDRIAQFPEDKRDNARLLVLDRGTISDHRISELDTILPAGTHLFFNDTRVIHARLLFRKKSGGWIEVFLLTPEHGEYELTNAMASRGSVRWNCLVGGARKWKEETLAMDVIIKGRSVNLKAVKGRMENGVYHVEFQWEDAGFSFSEVLDAAGQIPLPPYFNREILPEDNDRYQTVFARTEGSVAAPTAGLHFTPDLISRLKASGTSVHFLTLHVGAGTFKPVSSESIGEHSMHSEYFEADIQLVNQLIEMNGERVVPVGTTSLRSLESLYWLGAKCLQDEFDGEWEVGQWEGFDSPFNGTMKQSMSALATRMMKEGKTRIKARTSLLVAPGYRFRVATGLVTNFHMPGSTLLLLVAAMAGNHWKNAYVHALARGYRFLSYGDAMYIASQEMKNVTRG